MTCLDIFLCDSYFVLLEEKVEGRLVALKFSLDSFSRVCMWEGCLSVDGLLMKIFPLSPRCWISSILSLCSRISTSMLLRRLACSSFSCLNWSMQAVTALRREFSTVLISLSSTYFPLIPAFEVEELDILGNNHRGI